MARRDAAVHARVGAARGTARRAGAAAGPVASGHGRPTGALSHALALCVGRAAPGTAWPPTFGRRRRALPYSFLPVARARISVGEEVSLRPRTVKLPHATHPSYPWLLA